MTDQKKSRLEHDRLVDLYSRKRNEELLHLKSSFVELTEAAQHALREELIRRALWSEDQLVSLDEEPADAPIAANRIAVCECKSPEEAEVVCHLLQLASIATNIVGGAVPSRRIKVTVAHQDAEKALIILSQGIPDELTKELVAQFTAAEFVMPRCGNCGSTQVVLDSVETENLWSCSDCGTTWRDDPAVAPKVAAASLASTLPELDPETPDASLQEQPETEELLRHKKRIQSNHRAIILVVSGTLLVLLGGTFLPWTTLRWIGLCLWLPSETLWIMARLQLGGSFSVKAEAHTLVTTGLYSRIQNPIYVFGAMTAAGLMLYLDQPWCLLAFLVIIPLQVLRIRKERKILTSKFGEMYINYRNRTWF